MSTETTVSSQKQMYIIGSASGSHIVGNRDDLPEDANAIHFVLRLDTDPHARRAAKAYADSVYSIDAEFANDIMEHITKVENASRVTENILITGGAGSGKTRYLQQLVPIALQTGKKVVVVAEDPREWKHVISAHDDHELIVVSQETSLEHLLRMECNVLVVDVHNHRQDLQWQIVKGMAQRGITVWIAQQGGYDANGRRLDVHEKFVDTETAQHLFDTGILRWTTILAPHYFEPHYIRI